MSASCQRTLSMNRMTPLQVGKDCLINLAQPMVRFGGVKEKLENGLVIET